MDLTYIINELAEDREDYHNAMVPPIHQTSNFKFNTTEEFIAAIKNESKGYIYSRGNNPTLNILKKKLAALEGADDALLLSSGSAAITTAVMSCVSAGDHVLCVKDCYSWTKHLLGEIMPRFGVETTFVEGNEVSAFEKEVRPNTKLLFLESPTTFTFQLQDLEELSEFALDHGLTSVIDNSYGAAMSQHPISMGIDIVVYSASKYISGHSDVVAGVICSDQATIDKIFRSEFLTLGGICSPFNAWLMLRSLRTLELRIRRSSETAMQITKYLDEHPLVDKVHFPFLESHAQYDLALQSFKYPMGLFSVEFKTEGTDKISAFCNELEKFQMAVSWGGHESLVFSAFILNSSGKASGLKDNLVRFYIGLEEPEVLLHDLKNAIEIL